MKTPQVKIVNAQTGEEIIRDMNEAELAQLDIDKAASEAQIQAMEEKASAKAALLSRLGMTEDEAKLLLS
jgi:hypothetical protein